MKQENKDLHGNAPDKSKVALLIIDMINDFEFDGGEKLFLNVLPVSKNILKLKNEARKYNVPVIYVNDNFGKWKSDFQVLLEHCIADNTIGKEIAEILHPDKDDYFILKPKHSGFFSTSLDILLKYLETETLILTGITSDICVLFTANDAYIRDFKLIVPEDCSAAMEAELHKTAIENINRILKADVSSYENIDWDKITKTDKL